jgi:magnesium transporter
MAKEERKQKSRIYRRAKPNTLKKIAGLLFSLDGGMLASETLLLAKSG